VVIALDTPELPGRAVLKVSGEPLGTMLFHHLANFCTPKVLVPADIPITLRGTAQTPYALGNVAMRGEEYGKSHVTLTLDCPFINKGDISLALDILSSGKYSSVVACSEDTYDVMKQLRRGRKGFFHEDAARRTIFRKLNCLTVTQGDFIRETGSLIGMKSGILVLPRERALRLITGWDYLAAEAYATELPRVGVRPSEHRV
jgi:hypothetical protein